MRSEAERRLLSAEPLTTLQVLELQDEVRGHEELEAHRDAEQDHQDHIDALVQEYQDAIEEVQRDLEQVITKFAERVNRIDAAIEQFCSDRPFVYKQMKAALYDDA